MEWKRLFIKAAGFGAGVAAVLILIGGGLLWYSNRPKVPKPWDTHAIVAEYDYIAAEGDKNNIEVFYTLQNNTDFDYQIGSVGEVQMAAKLEKEKAIAIETSEQRRLTADFPIFIPARGRITFRIHIDYPYEQKFDDKASEDARYDFGTRLAKFATTEFSNLDGFVLLDQAHRYRIEFPSGWKARSKEPLRIKTQSPPK